jgi:hypothetical protein
LIWLAGGWLASAGVLAALSLCFPLATAGLPCAGYSTALALPCYLFQFFSSPRTCGGGEKMYFFQPLDYSIVVNICFVNNEQLIYLMK